MLALLASKAKVLRLRPLWLARARNKPQIEAV